jgi:insulysin
LFNQDSTDKELNAIDSENAKNLQSDAWRMYQLLKSCADSKHPFSKFGTGNKITLLDWPRERDINIRDHLLRFHQTYYSANIMKLSVIGKGS